MHGQSLRILYGALLATAVPLAFWLTLKSAGFTQDANSVPPHISLQSAYWICLSVPMLAALVCLVVRQAALDSGERRWYQRLLALPVIDLNPDLSLTKLFKGGVFYGTAAFLFITSTWSLCRVLTAPLSFSKDGAPPHESHWVPIKRAFSEILWMGQVQYYPLVGPLLMLLLWGGFLVCFVGAVKAIYTKPKSFPWPYDDDSAR